MKTLLLMRHAKSSFKEGEIPDFERPLSKRGEKDAPRMGKMLKDKDLTPDLILSSTAQRASQTAELVAEKCKYEREIVFVNDFYLGEPDAYLNALHDLGEENTEVVLVIGHNPGLESLLQLMTDKVASLPTSAIAHLGLPIRTWKSLSNEIIADLKHIWLPRDIK